MVSETTRASADGGPRGDCALERRLPRGSRGQRRALRPLRVLERGLAGALILVLQAYQLLLSPLLGGACRYEPSCSSYAIDAIRQHGPLGGSGRAIRRILRCHPFHPGGYDPVN
ncbi:MAG: membrane protein insertion efficiency factor YidD [Myxococcota bacterium]